MPVTHRMRKLSRKRRGGAPPQRRFHGAGRHVTEVESETLLTLLERKRIDNRIREHQIAGIELPLHYLDYRWHEIKRKTGFQPGWKDKVWGTVYKWWIQLDVHDRIELARLSKGAGMRENT
jgi:hypothetical protein